MLPHRPWCPNSRVISLDSATSWDWCQRTGQRANIHSWFFMPKQYALAQPSSISWFLKTAGLVHPESLTPPLNT
eukprot:11181909-Lingulodinium_polyedra.AAC.1